MEKRRTARANHCRFGGPGSKRPSSSEDRKGYGLRVVIRAPRSVLLPRQWPPGTDPVVLIKMVLIQHLFGIPSLRQTYREIQVNVAYRWFLGYGLLDNIPHFATVSYAFCKWRASARRSWAKEFMHSAKRPLSVSLRMQKRNTQCVIHTTEAWPQSHDGSGLNMLP